MMASLGFTKPAATVEIEYNNKIIIPCSDNYINTIGIRLNVSDFWDEAVAGANNVHK